MIMKKIMLLGEIGVGKTSIAKRLVFDRFDGDYKATIGTDVYLYEVDPPPAGKPFQFIVWDSDGNFGEAIFRHVYVKEAAAAMIVGDVSRRGTIEAMVRLGEGFADAFPGRHITLVLNKLDLVEDPDALELPRKLDEARFPLVRTSAKTGLNVKHAFHEAATTIVRRGL
jgi:small GTP-binding protein